MSPFECACSFSLGRGIRVPGVQVLSVFEDRFYDRVVSSHPDRETFIPEKGVMRTAEHTLVLPGMAKKNVKFIAVMVTAGVQVL